MADESILMAVEGDDPCGADLRWDPAYMAVGQALDNMIAQGDEAVVDGELAGDATEFFDEIEKGVRDLSERTKDLRLLAIRAEANWMHGGLAPFAAALEDLVVAAETWPDPDTGVHPRADEEDGDLGERAAALGRLLNRSPSIAASIGWGEREPSFDESNETAATLRGIFDSWTARLEAAFGSDLPVRTEVWNSIKKLIGTPSPAEGDETGADGGAQTGPIGNAWDSIDRAIGLMETQDRHSPALPVLHMLSRWRSMGIIDISMKMRVSGVSLEQLLDSIHKQLQGP